MDGVVEVLVWFNRPTYIILPSEVVGWLRLARGWLEPVLPNLVIGWRGISTRNRVMAQKPNKLDKIQPKTDAEIASLMAYYGIEKTNYAITALSPFIDTKPIVSNIREGYTFYQLFPFTYFFVLPEPIPPPDIAIGSKNVISEVSLFFPSIKPQRRKLEPSSAYLSTILTIYYLVNTNEWNFGDESMLTLLRGNIIEFLQTIPPENFLWSICLALAVKYNWTTSIPPAHLHEIQWVRYAYYQALHTLEVRRKR